MKVIPFHGQLLAARFASAALVLASCFGLAGPLLAQSDWRYFGGLPERPSQVEIDRWGGVALSYPHELYYVAPGAARANLVASTLQDLIPRVESSTDGALLLSAWMEIGADSVGRFTLKSGARGQLDTLSVDAYLTPPECSYRVGTSPIGRATRRIRDTLFSGTVWKVLRAHPLLTLEYAVTATDSFGLHPSASSVLVREVYANGEVNPQTLLYLVPRRTSGPAHLGPAQASDSVPIPFRCGRLLHAEAIAAHREDTLVAVFETSPASDTLLYARYIEPERRWTVEPIFVGESPFVVAGGLRDLYIGGTWGYYRSSDVRKSVPTLVARLPVGLTVRALPSEGEYLVLEHSETDSLFVFDGTAARALLMPPRGELIERVIATPAGGVLAKAAPPSWNRPARWWYLAGDSIAAEPVDGARSYIAAASRFGTHELLQVWRGGHTELQLSDGADTALLLRRPDLQVWRVEGTGPSSRLVDLGGELVLVDTAGLQALPSGLTAATAIYIDGRDSLVALAGDSAVLRWPGGTLGIPDIRTVSGVVQRGPLGFARAKYLFWEFGPRLSGSVPVLQPINRGGVEYGFSFNVPGRFLSAGDLTLVAYKMHRPKCRSERRRVWRAPGWSSSSLSPTAASPSGALRSSRSRYRRGSTARRLRFVSIPNGYTGPTRLSTRLTRRASRPPTRVMGAWSWLVTGGCL